MTRSPANPVNPQRARSLRRSDVYSALRRIELEGLSPLEASDLEELLGYSVDSRRPTDFQIGRVLQLRAELDDHMGINREAHIARLHEEGRISDEVHDELLRLEWFNSERERASAALRVLTAAQWGTGLTPEEQACLRALQAWKAGGLGEPPALPAALERDAYRLLNTERRRWRGELPRERRFSKTDRRRMKTFETPSFRSQLGRLASLEKPSEIARSVAELRRQMKDLGWLPADHDKRRSGALSS